MGVSHPTLDSGCEGACQSSFGLRKHENNKHARVPLKTECGCPRMGLPECIDTI